MPYYKLPGIFGNFRYAPSKGILSVKCGCSSGIEDSKLHRDLRHVVAEYTDIKVISTPSAETNGNVAYLSLTEGLTFMFSSYEIRYSDNGQILRIGVRIDKIVEPTIEEIKTSRKEILERAIKIITDLP